MDAAGDRERPPRQRHRRCRPAPRSGGLHPGTGALSTLIRRWPAAGLAGLILIGLAVGKGSTPLDDWFHNLGDEQPQLRELLLLTDGRVLLTLCAIVLIVALVQRRWRLAAVTMVLAVIGQAVSYHYFTDTIGALFLGTALVCAAMSIAGLDTCQPERDGDHSSR